ncbi:MAG: NUDIX hydrolase [uncultured bacterium]|nr:MAG: NUDIX hydrolase [uncultured bacterium]
MKNNGPWKIKSSKEIYQNPWINVREDQVVRPDRKDGIFGVVEMKPGISVIATNNYNNLYLNKEFHYISGKYSIEAVNGAIDNNETPLEAAKRELKEEHGIIAKDWINLGFVDPYTEIIKSRSYLFLARNISFVKHEQEGTETIKRIKVKFNEAVKMVLESKITHSPSCVLILKTKEYLENK